MELFEEIVLIQNLQPGDQFRLALDSPNIYTVKEHFQDKNPETKVKLNQSTSIYFLAPGRKVFKIIG